MRDAGGVDTPAELGAVQTALGSLLGAGLGGKEQALGPRHLNLSWALPFPVHWPLPEHALCAVDTTETWLRHVTPAWFSWAAAGHCIREEVGVILVVPAGCPSEEGS